MKATLGSNRVYNWECHENIMLFRRENIVEYAREQRRDTKWLRQLLEAKEKEIRQRGGLSTNDKWGEVLRELRGNMETAHQACGGDPKSEEWRAASERYAQAIKAHGVRNGDTLPYH